MRALLVKTAVDAIAFYRQRFGLYPARNLTIIPGTLGSRGRFPRRHEPGGDSRAGEVQGSPGVVLALDYRTRNRPSVLARVRAAAQSQRRLRLADDRHGHLHRSRVLPGPRDNRSALRSAQAVSGRREGRLRHDPGPDGRAGGQGRFRFQQRRDARKGLRRHQRAGRQRWGAGPSTGSMPGVSRNIAGGGSDPPSSSESAKKRAGRAWTGSSSSGSGRTER